MASSTDDLAGDEQLKMAQRKACHRRVIKTQHRGLSRLVRANAKHLVESGQINVFPLCAEDHSQMDTACIRSHMQRHLRNHYGHARKPAHNEHVPRRIDCVDQEGRELAYSDVPLPSDGHRLARPPTLERQDAFCDASSSRGRVHVRRLLGPGPGYDDDGEEVDGKDDEDRQLAHLYRMGLLYDSEQDQGGEGFNLNSIRHEEPLYSVRPARRARKSTRARRVLDRRLHLDLSFSDLGDDEALAQYLVSLGRAEEAEGDGDGDANASVEDVHKLSRDAVASSQSGPQTPLRVIYELATSPPPLVTDLLSDYDCFSDGELDDVPLQREVKEDEDSTFSDAWVMLGEAS
ncbi:hypothetical protein E4U42_005735 [Claviceps africana]|uniref:Uncharacterized protein n=1 Tax=Claviceps africana TaxID=83212 RepID=A0A8K0NH80_9HYPO|nr:hypothetical protein E4U42_005735 [Claviceps africana]